jgi:hypothetical protein
LPLIISLNITLVNQYAVNVFYKIIKTIQIQGNSGGATREFPSSSIDLTREHSTFIIPPCSRIEDSPAPLLKGRRAAKILSGG